MLTRIVEAKSLRLVEDKRLRPLDSFDLGAYKTRSFKEALRGEGLNVIAELKRASPSKGLINKDMDPVRTAMLYDRAGVKAISVVTEEDFFRGRREFIGQVRARVDRPILRKDFIIDSYQIYESKALGADCILLIAAILDDENLLEFKKLAQSLDLDILFEVHTREELERGLRLGFDLIGINNRNLLDFTVDLRTTENLIKGLDQDLIVVSESGVGTREDFRFLEDLGLNGVLIGESLMRAESIEEKLKYLRGD